MNILGIDPDTKTTGLGIVRDGRPVFGGLVAVINPRASFEVRRLQMARRLNEAISNLRFATPDGGDIDIIVVEGQTIYTDGKARPNDILHLGQIAGAALAAALENYPMATVLVPEPRDWKGSARKDAFTKALLRRLKLKPTARGLEFSESESGCRLPGTVKLPSAKATHVIDALGMAHWAWMRTPR